MIYENGQLPDAALAPIANGRLRRDAAAAWNAMNVEARKRGLELLPNGSKSSYRTLAQQQELYRLYLAGTGNLAAKPGTSNHGWGLAVDLATLEMRDLVDHIGERFGWSKKWSDAQSEWWHLKWRENVWRGDDPGPDGESVAAPIPTTPEGTVALAVATMTDGRFEVFVETKTGEVFHAWQSKEGGWAGAQKGKRVAEWYSLGTPGGGK